MIGIVLTIINTAFFAGTWYFLGRCSIYRMIIEDYKELLDIASRMKITVYHIVCVNGHRAKDIHEREYSS